jgi:hypothetical protein
MKLAELQAMNLEALQRLARSRGIPGAATLERSALIAALATLPDDAEETAPAGAAEALRWEEVEVEGEPRHRRHTLPGSALPSRPGDYDGEIMARMYMEQGHPERAAEIYRQLLVASPDDPELAELLAEAELAAEALAAEVQKARRRPSAPPHPPPAPYEPFGMLDFEELPESYGVDEVEVLFKDPFSVFAYWEITEGGMNAA